MPRAKDSRNPHASPVMRSIESPFYQIKRGAFTPTEPNTAPVSFGLGFRSDIEYSAVDFSLARSTNYEGMDEYFREFKREDLVRRPIMINAAFATNKGFETSFSSVSPKEGEAEDPDKHKSLKAFVDGINRVVNYDNVMFRSMIMIQIEGLAGWFIVRDKKSEIPLNLIELQPWNMTPKVNRKSGMLEGWTYTGTPKIEPNRPGFDDGLLPPQDVLYFTNSELFTEFIGLSDIEPIIHQIESRRYIVQEGYKETVKSNWAPIAILKVDTGKATKAQSETIIDNLLKQTIMAPGRFIGVNKDVTVDIVDVSPRLAGIKDIKKDLDVDIISNFGVPKFLLNREEQVNRATAFAEAQMYINGKITDKQRLIGRQSEERWLNMLSRLFLKTPEDKPLEVAGSHNWNPVTVEDFAELIANVAALANTKLVPDSYILKKHLGIDFKEMQDIEREFAEFQNKTRDPPLTGPPVNDDGDPFESSLKHANLGIYREDRKITIEIKTAMLRVLEKMEA